MNTTSKIELLKTIKSLDNEANRYLDSIPVFLHEYKMSIIDNDYANDIGRQKDAMLQFIFGDLTEDICWFLYEWSPDRCNQIWINDKEYLIKSEDDYYNYLRTEYKVE